MRSRPHVAFAWVVEAVRTAPSASTAATRRSLAIRAAAWADMPAA